VRFAERHLCSVSWRVLAKCQNRNRSVNVLADWRYFLSQVCRYAVWMSLECLLC
jgi:hypothetical protein